MNTNQNPFELLDHKIFAALETYSNVHRGSGHKSKVTTHLYNYSRQIVLNHLELNKSYEVIFCSQARLKTLTHQLQSQNYKTISSDEIGLPIGVHALVSRKSQLNQIANYDQGGGTAKLLAPDWAIHAKAPDRFEAGTPAIINVITFACALQLTKKYGKECFFNSRKNSPEETWEEYPGLSGKELLHSIQKTIIGESLFVPTTNGNNKFINLDNSASTPTFQAVWKTYAQTLRQKPNSRIIESARNNCSDFLNAPRDMFDIDFTTNTTESINQLADVLSNEFDECTVILSSFLEHSSNDLPWRKIKKASIVRLHFNSDGFIQLEEMKQILQEYNIDRKYGAKRIKLVAITGASNVLGACNNLEAIAKIVHEHNAKLFVDAAQLVAHRKIDVLKTGIDFLAFSAHKIYAPFGVGVLIRKKDSLGENNDSISEKNENENLAGIAALDKVLSLFKRIGMETIQEEEQQLTQYALNKLLSINGLKILGINNSKHPEIEHKLGVIPFNLGNVVSFKVAKELTYQQGIGVRVGCHCAHILVKKILGVGPGLESFQRFMQRFFSFTIFPGVARVSFGIENTKEDIDSLVTVLNRITNKNETRDKSKIKQEVRSFIENRANLVYE